MMRDIDEGALLQQPLYEVCPDSQLLEWAAKQWS